MMHCFCVTVAAHKVARSGPLPRTASLAKWLRRPPRGSNPAGTGIFPGLVIPVT